jgi:hypothetical protein
VRHSIIDIRNIAINTPTTPATPSRRVISPAAATHSMRGRNLRGSAAGLGLTVLCLACGPAWAAVAPPLGVAEQFAVLGHSAVTGATGAGVVVEGDVGSSPTATISNFPPSSAVVPYSVHFSNDGVVQQAHTDAVAAYAALASQGTGTVLPDNLATVGALTPGVYSFVTGTPDLPASATLTLNGSGIFVFNVTNALTANVLSNVVGTANPCQVFWRVGSSATLNGTRFMGTVIADASVTVGAGANVAGRTLAGTGATGAVTIAGSGGNTVGGCSVPTVVPPVGGVGLGKAFLPVAIGGAGEVSILSIVLSNNNAGVATLTSPLTDVLPSGMVVAAIPNAATTCGSGGIGGGGGTAVAGANTVSLATNSTIPGGTPGVCTLTVDVTVDGAAGGTYVNTLAIGALQTSTGNANPANAAPASATLVVAGPPVAMPTLSGLALGGLAALLALAGLMAMRRATR